MNLIQIQNRLKEMPTQAVMAYANGKNPMVPPYLALGELNRRKQVEQTSKTAEAPEQSVKEKIENEVRLMQTMAGRQQEAMQNQAQMLAQQSTTAPASTPATNAEAFASGGIARLRSRFNFNGGGIVAFAAPTEENNNSLVTDEEEEKKRRKTYPSMAQYEGKGGTVLPERSGYEGMSILEFLKQAGKDISKQAGKYFGGSEEENAARMYGGRTRDVYEARRDRGPDPFSEPDLPMPVSTAKSAPEVKPEAKPKDTRTGEVKTTASNAPASGRPSSEPTAGSGLANKYLSQYLEQFTNQQQYLPKSEMELLEEAKKTNPELAEKAGSRYERLMDQIAARDKEDRERFKQQEKERQGRRFIDVLSGAGGEMGRFASKEQAGGRGILNLLGGMGRQSAMMREQDIDRLNKQRGLEREQDILQAQIYGEIDKARRAEARGDVKSQAEHEKNIANLKSEFEKNKITNLGKAAEYTETLRKNLTDEQLKRLELDQRAYQISYANRDLIRERAALLASLPENKGKSMTELLQMAAGLTQGAQFESAEVRRLKEAEAAWEKGKINRLQQGIKPGSAEEAAMRKEHDKKWGIAPGSTGGGSSSRIQVLGKE